MVGLPKRIITIVEIKGSEDPDLDFLHKFLYAHQGIKYGENMRIVELMGCPIHWGLPREEKNP